MELLLQRYPNCLKAAFLEKAQVRHTLQACPAEFLHDVILALTHCNITALPLHIHVRTM